MSPWTAVPTHFNSLAVVAGLSTEARLVLIDLVLAAGSQPEGGRRIPTEAMSARALAVRTGMLWDHGFEDGAQRANAALDECAAMGAIQRDADGTTRLHPSLWINVPKSARKAIDREVWR